MPKSKRLSILNEQEIQKLYGQPQFAKDDRPYIFALGEKEENYVRRLASPDSKAYFLLLLSYFREKHIFFEIDYSKAYHDIRWLRSKLIHNDIQPRNPSRNSLVKYRKKILEFTGYVPFDEKAKNSIRKLSLSSVRRSLKPRNIFLEIIDYCRSQKIETPPYYYLSDQIGEAIELEQERLCKIVRQVSKKHSADALLSLFKGDLGDIHFSSVKREAKNLRLQEISDELERFDILSSTQNFSSTCLNKFSLSTQNVKYLASLAAHYRIHSLKSFPVDFASVILVCYVHFRLQKSTDILADAFLNYILRFKNRAKEFAKEEMYKLSKEQSIDIKKVAKILEFFTDEEAPSNLTFKQVREQAFEILTRDEIEKFCLGADKKYGSIDSFRWRFFAEKHLSFKKNIRPIIRRLKFYGHPRHEQLLAAVEKLKSSFDGKDGNNYEMSLNFLSSRIRPYIRVDGKIDPTRYEFALYFQLAKNIEKKEIFIDHCTKYRSLSEDLISEVQWKNRDKYLESTPFQRLKSSPEILLGELEEELEKKLQKVNRDISLGIKQDIVFKGASGERKWTVPYSKREDRDQENGLFSHLKPVNICDVISYVHQRTRFLDSFEHIQPRFSKSTLDYKNISACLVAAGSNLGLQKIAEIADISVSKLSSTYRNFFHVDFIQRASDKVIADAADLPAYKHFHVGKKGLVHAAADGQKFKMKYRNQFARHSPKYFNQGVGVVAYSLVANHFPIHALTIGAHDHESHFLFDLIFGNKTAIDPDVISTDMHGINNINFALLYMFGRTFAPRYKRIQRQFSNFLGFQNPKNYQSLIIAPQRKVDRKLIISEWENILKIFLSLAMKETSQSLIVRKLSSHQFSDRTKRAIWELNGTIKSIYLLDYLDDELLRQDVCKAQNRSESYHQLKRAIANIAGGTLRGSKEADISIWNECARLLTNCIIYYNTDILSRVLEKSGASPAFERALNRISPVSWRHINFLGKYVFRDEEFELDIDKIVGTIDLDEILRVA